MILGRGRRRIETQNQEARQIENKFFKDDEFSLSIFNYKGGKRNAFRIFPIPA